MAFDDSLDRNAEVGTITCTECLFVLI
jgi:hypothetical protein